MIAFSYLCVYVILILCQHCFTFLLTWSNITTVGKYGKKYLRILMEYGVFLLEKDGEHHPDFSMMFPNKGIKEISKKMYKSSCLFFCHIGLK